MENRTSYDLNAAVEKWRQELAGQPGLAPEDRLELETHLRETIAELRGRGLNDEEAFWLARRRIGQPGQLAREFVKVARKRVFLRMGVWSLATWIALASLVFALSGDLKSVTGYWWLVLTMPSAVVFCAWRALRTGAAARRWTRVIFWTGAIAGIVLLAINFQVQSKILTQAYDRNLLIVSGILPVLVLMLAGVREVRPGGFKALGFGWMLDIAGGTLCLAILLATAYFSWLEGVVEPLRMKAEKRWTEIGRPMPEFEKTMQPIAENESLRELTHDLKPFGVVSFYKDENGGGFTPANTMKLPKEVFSFICNTDNRAGVSINLPVEASAELDANANDFDRLYAGILRRDPPVWQMDRATGFSLVEPHFLNARLLTQWILADVYHRLERGDEKGAADAIAADLRVMHGMGGEPDLICLMADMSFESFFASAIARLPGDPAAIQRLPGEVETRRAQFQRDLQAESWALMHTFEKTNPGPDDARIGHALPGWITRLILPLACQSFDRFECSRAWLYEADLTEICGRARELANSDLGEHGMQEAEIRNASIFPPSFLRAWLSLNCVLLVDEQAEMIRSARAQMQAGNAGNLGEQQSAVISGSKWILTGDLATNSVTVKLTPLPKWTTENEVANDEFWLIPLDGSKSWKCGVASRPALSFRD